MCGIVRDWQWHLNGWVRRVKLFNGLTLYLRLYPDTKVDWATKIDYHKGMYWEMDTRRPGFHSHTTPNVSGQYYTNRLSGVHMIGTMQRFNINIHQGIRHKSTFIPPYMHKYARTMRESDYMQRHIIPFVCGLLASQGWMGAWAWLMWNVRWSEHRHGGYVRNTWRAMMDAYDKIDNKRRKKARAAAVALGSKGKRRL